MKLSFSHIKSYLLCPKQYAFLGVEKKPQTYSTQAHFGSIVHNVLAEYYTRILNNKQSLFPEEISLSTLQEIFIQKTQHLNHSWLSNAWKQLEQYEQSFPSSRQSPLYIEHAFSYIYTNTILQGRIDRIDQHADGSVSIIEYKTQPCTPKKHILQGYFYAYYIQNHTSYTIRSIEIHDLHQTQCFSHSYSEESKAFLMEKIHTVIEGIAKKDFHASPGKHCFSCPYRSICHEAMKKEANHVIE